MQEIRDQYLLQTWKKETNLTNCPDDPAVQSGATDVFVPKPAETGTPASEPNKSEFTAATWNTENLIASGGRSSSPQAIKAKAEVLKKVNADVVALQEVGDLKTLDQFRKEFIGEGVYPYRILVQGNDSSINVGLLSKFPIKKVYTYRDHVFPGAHGQPTKFSRDLLEAVVQITPQFPMKIFVCHLKSKRGGGDSDLKREAEAKEVKKIISRHLEKDPDSLIAVAGDFNDFPDSPAVKIVEGGANPVLDPLTLENRKNQPTHHSVRYGDSRLDYLLLSPALMKRYQAGSAEVKGKENPGASDHDPLELRFKAFPAQKYFNQPLSSSSSNVINP
ncbi:MAG: endonuclease/exonuclease/phosphatase family protein [Firmicutes bacterium]|nr:endonuclease/exonuclease/phosphatase family protein [Bacillota bacterium]